MLKPEELKPSDLSPALIWLGTTLYGSWIYIRGERAKKAEVQRQKDQDARQAKLDAKSENKEELSEDVERADRWKADSETWEKRATRYCEELEATKKERDVLRAEIQKRDDGWKILNTSYEQVLEAEISRYARRDGTKHETTANTKPIGLLSGPDPE